MSQLYPCSKGHQSTDPDYCSDCGTKIEVGTAVATTTATAGFTSNTDPFAPPTPGNETPCPDCGTMHRSTDGIFCEICGYNFQTQAHGEIPVPPAVEANVIPTVTPTVDLTATTAPVTPVSTPTVKQWQLEITIDPTLAHADSPPAPTQAAIVVEISKTMNLIGRTSETRANYPDIPLDFDEAVSHRHAVLNIDVDQTLILRDIGSSNGTYVNGIEIKPMADVALKDGDVFNLGHWTKITVKGII
jgi:hypothetical protein